jgi:hypothetical protein
MLDKIAAHALKEYNGDEKKAAAFIDGFVKEAVDFGRLGNEMAKQFAGSIGKGIGTVILGGGVALAGKGILDSMHSDSHARFKAALETAIEHNPVLHDADKTKLAQYGETIFKFSPSVAADPNVLGAVLSNAIHFNGIFPDTIKMLVELESRYQQNNTFSFGPKMNL